MHAVCTFILRFNLCLSAHLHLHTFQHLKTNYLPEGFSGMMKAPGSDLVSAVDVDKDNVETASHGANRLQECIFHEISESC